MVRRTPSIVRGLVGVAHEGILATVGCFLLTFLITFPVFCVAWIYFFEHGAAAPDKLHAFELRNHGSRSYIPDWQRQLLDVLEILFGLSGILALPGLLLWKGFRWLFPPNRWGYDAS